jgi:cytosine/adenosine deaminase-related metal-dependent hydrolase
LVEQKRIFSSLALIGSDLNIEKNVVFEIQNDKITNISKDVDISQGIDIESKYFFENSVIIPGFINGHTHIGDSFAKELGYKLNIKEIVGKKGLKHYLLNTIDDDIIIDGIKNSIKEMILSGTTTFVDFRENGIQGINLFEKAENSLLNSDPDLKIGKIILGRPNKELGELHEVLKKCDGIGLSSSNSFSDDELSEIKDKCEKHNKFISVHVSETKEERLNADKKFGSSDVYRSILLLNANPLIHAIHIDKKDLRLIKSKNRNIVICPRANSYYGVGFPPVQEFIKESIQISIGTDNVMANSLNLFREFEYIIKYLRSVFGPEIIHPIDILKMVTVNPSQIYKLNDRGWLDVGKRADFMIIDLHKPHLQPMNKILETITLRCGARDIETMFLGGKEIEITK